MYQIPVVLHLVGDGGFEPPKSKTTDLQSAPFGHSGNLPYLFSCNARIPLFTIKNAVSTGK